MQPSLEQTSQKNDLLGLEKISNVGLIG